MLQFLNTCGAALVAVSLLSSAVAAQDRKINESDLAALRYFLSIDDQESITAERRRLLEAFPGADVDEMIAQMDARASMVDTTEMWRLIASGEFAAARDLIGRTQAARPDWTPPEDMMSVLDETQGQAAFEAAFAAQSLPEAMAAVNAYPMLMTCSRINNAWRLAELQAVKGLLDQAVITNSGILTTCRNPDHVIATLQKTARIGSPEIMESLFELAASRNPALAPRLAALETELAPIIGVPEDRTTKTAGRTPPPPRGVTPAVRPSAPRVVEPRVAEPRAVVAPVPAASAAPAAVSTDTVTAAARAADRQDWSTCLQLTANARTPEALGQRGWCAMNYGRPREAIAAFTTVARSGATATQVRDATYGAILSYMSAGMTAEAANLYRRADLSADQRRTAGRTVLSALASEAFERKRYRDAIAYIDRLSQSVGTLDRGMAMLRGYALLRENRIGPAREQFRAVHATQPGPDSLNAIAQAGQ
ncbi:tetratricopeptide repeat protein [Palleronia abyssalis]|uniref:Beta-barrel assembly-enhancing protease n=1 Tax=Palleronia abyssalis TaxID=1501240 RepID=A0A2R8C0S6_9RHOB|nr:tetratricopeptide repeat protein [Palleronia abyssalis]SPJ25959.1 hypothetical protein PAA8504_03815 [Palleronia abyssalis]